MSQPQHRHRRTASRQDALQSVDEDGPVEADPSGRYLRYPVLLGRGACKSVYKGFDTHTGTEVAWNQVHLAGADLDPVALDYLIKEIKLLKNLHHKNIMTFHDWFYNNRSRTINFITEMFISGSLRQYRKKVHSISLNVIKRWAWQILEGLVYLHGHTPPIVHRDLKCDNVFLNANVGQVKIGDLGLATCQQGLSVVGTPEFLAPEIYEENYDQKVDIYSFGMCLLELATQEYPYSECQRVAQIFRKVSMGIKPAALERVSEELREMIDLCIDHDPQKRPEARELIKHHFFDGVRRELSCSGSDSQRHAAEDTVGPLKSPSQQLSAMLQPSALSDPGGAPATRITLASVLALSNFGESIAGATTASLSAVTGQTMLSPLTGVQHKGAVVDVRAGGVGAAGPDGAAVRMQHGADAAGSSDAARHAVSSASSPACKPISSHAIEVLDDEEQEGEELLDSLSQAHGFSRMDGEAQTGVSPSADGAACYERQRHSINVSDFLRKLDPDHDMGAPSDTESMSSEEVVVPIDCLVNELDEEEGSKEASSPDVFLRENLSCDMTALNSPKGGMANVMRLSRQLSARYPAAVPRAALPLYTAGSDDSEGPRPARGVGESPAKPCLPPRPALNRNMSEVLRMSDLFAARNFSFGGVNGGGGCSAQAHDEGTSMARSSSVKDIAADLPDGLRSMSSDSVLREARPICGVIVRVKHCRKGQNTEDTNSNTRGRSRSPPAQRVLSAPAASGTTVFRSSS